MINLEINKTVLKVPSKFEELRLSDGIEIMNFIKDSSTLKVQDKAAIISTLSGLQPEVIIQMTPKTIEDIYSSLSFMNNEESQVVFFKTFTLNNTNFGFTDFENLTTHEFADLDFYLNESDYPLENLDKIMAILFRPIKNKKQSLRNILKNIIIRIFVKNIVPKIYNSYEIEEYKDIHIKNAELFGKKIDMGFAIASYQYMLKERQNLMDEFPTIFKQPIPEKDKDQYDEEPKKEIKPFEQVWGLYHCIASLSTSLFEREAWYKKPVREFFTYLSYYNTKTQVENQRAMAHNIV